jgi:hypothetical protein
MKTVIINKTGEILERVKRTFYTVQVMGLGLFLPFLFVFGITYNGQDSKAVNDTKISVPAHTGIDNNATVNFVNVLPDQNS